MIRAALILVFLGCTLFAQQIFTNSTVNFDATGGIRATFSALTGNPGAVVTGAPFSADRVTEHVQTLADGTHIRPDIPSRMWQLCEAASRSGHAVGAAWGSWRPNCTPVVSAPAHPNLAPIPEGC